MSEAVKPYRADYVLTTAIAIVALLVLGLVFVLSGGGRVYDEANAARVEMRAIRNAAIAYTREQTAMVSTARSRRDAAARTRFDAAREAALNQLRELRRLNAEDAEGIAIVGRLETLNDDLVATLAPVRRTGRTDDALVSALVQDIEHETQAIHNLVIRRSDAIREREESARRQIDTLAGALALLSLIVAGLAILALRRERKQWRAATQAAEEARARATESDLAKTRFLAVASHDMRQPLHALTLYLSALERRVEGQEARDIIAKMDRATQSMVGMFATLLDLARIQAGVVKPEIEAVRLADVVDRIVAEHPGSSIGADDTNVLLRTDPLLLERLLRNLVSNALKHGGGSARIEIAQHGEEVEICVADAGPGIAEEDHARIFEEFVRLDGPAEGLGLGLAIVKRIADLLHMPLSLESAPGKGARFSIRAPIEREGAHTQVGREAVDRLDGAKVLVIDDDSLARSAVSRMLSDLGAEVRACGNEADALTLIREGFTPELLVMDLRLDGALAGVDVARRLVQLIEPSSKVIVITGDTAAETLTMLRGSGYPWLIKPVDPREMTAKAAEALRSVEPVNST